MSKVTTRQMQCARMFCALGYMPSGASAIVGNLSWESGGANLPTTFRRKNLDHGSNGMPQWRLSRLTGYENYVKSLQSNATESELWQHYGRMDYQVQYIDIELKRDYPMLCETLKKGGSIAALTANFTWSYERPSKKYAHLNERIAFAQAIYGGLDPATNGVVSIANAIDMDATTHDKAATGGVALASIGAIGGSVTIARRIMPGMTTLEIVVLVAGALLFVVGLVVYGFYAANARRVRSAKIGLDTTIPPKSIVDPPKVSTEPAKQPVDSAKPALPPKLTAAEEEAASIKAMLDHAIPPAKPQAAPLETAAPAAPATHTLT